VASSVSPFSRLSAGTILEQRYVIEGELGSGGLGLVYKARHLALDAPVAIKILRPEYAYDDEFVSRLRDEARLAASLKCDHLVRVLDVGDMAPGTIYVVLEYVDGHDLETELAHRGRLPIEDAVRYGLEICAALSEAHSRGVVHRDLKPENLLLERLADGRTRIKVADFGAAKRLWKTEGALADPGGYVGTPWYMAPEQILDSREVDARADIWSFGVVLYEMLTDRLPFSGDTPPEVYASILCNDLARPRTVRPEVPRELERIVLRCLSKDRMLRYPDVGELVLDLEALGLHVERPTADLVLRRLGTVQVCLEALRGEE
jgi:serine/threonine-protein kinase